MDFVYSFMNSKSLVNCFVWNPETINIGRNFPPKNVFFIFIYSFGGGGAGQKLYHIYVHSSHFWLFIANPQSAI